MITAESVAKNNEGFAGGYRIRVIVEEFNHNGYKRKRKKHGSFSSETEELKEDFEQAERVLAQAKKRILAERAELEEKTE